MEYTVLNDGVTKVSKLSLGTWAFSNAPVWGVCDDRAAVETVHKALDMGINLIDTAEKYGDGQAEIVLGKALKDRRDKAIVASKVYSDHLHYQGVIDSCEASLRRLNTDYIDILQIHWPNEDISSEDTFEAFDKLKKDGKIRMVSVCNHGLQCLEHVRDKHIVMNQMPYSLVWRVAEHQFSPAMKEEHIYLWAYSPLGQGLLTGKFRKLDDVPLNRRTTRIYDSKWGQGLHTDGGYEQEVFDFLDKLRVLCDETGYTMSEYAFAFLRNRENMGSILVGARNIDQLDQNVKAFNKEIPLSLIDKVDYLSAELKEKMGENADLWQNGRNRCQKEGRMY